MFENIKKLFDTEEHILNEPDTGHSILPDGGGRPVVIPGSLEGVRANNVPAAASQNIPQMNTSQSDVSPEVAAALASITEEGAPLRMSSVPVSQERIGVMEERPSGPLLVAGDGIRVPQQSQEAVRITPRVMETPLVRPTPQEVPTQKPEEETQNIDRTKLTPVNDEAEKPKSAELAHFASLRNLSNRGNRTPAISLEDLAQKRALENSASEPVEMTTKVSATEEAQDTSSQKSEELSADEIAETVAMMRGFPNDTAAKSIEIKKEETVDTTSESTNERAGTKEGYVPTSMEKEVAPITLDVTPEIKALETETVIDAREAEESNEESFASSTEVVAGKSEVEETTVPSSVVAFPAPALSTDGVMANEVANDNDTFSEPVVLNEQVEKAADKIVFSREFLQAVRDLKQKSGLEVDDDELIEVLKKYLNVQLELKEICHGAELEDGTDIDSLLEKLLEGESVRQELKAAVAKHQNLNGRSSFKKAA